MLDKTVAFNYCLNLQGNGKPLPTNGPHCVSCMGPDMRGAVWPGVKVMKMENLYFEPDSSTAISNA